MKRLTSGLVTLLLAGHLHAEDRYPFAAGPIFRVEPEARQIMIKDGAATRSYFVTDQSYLLDGNTRLSLDKLKPGLPVKLNYYTNDTGRALIRRLKVDHPPADPMPDKAK